MEREKQRIFVCSSTELSRIALGNRAAPPPPTQAPGAREEGVTKKKEEEEDEDEETSSSSEETESETEEESETDAHPSATTSSTTPSTVQDRQRTESAMARTDIGPLLARSAEARRGSKEDSPTTRQVYFPSGLITGGFPLTSNIVMIDRSART